MTRYIDADVLSEALMTRWNTADKNAEKIISSVMADIVTPIVVGMPTVDAVEVVRCKDCIHYESDGGAMMVCNVTDMVCDNDDFCSYGERREESEVEE